MQAGPCVRALLVAVAVASGSTTGAGGTRIIHANLKLQTASDVQLVLQSLEDDQRGGPGTAGN